MIPSSLFFARIIKSAREMPVAEMLLLLCNHLKLYFIYFPIMVKEARGKDNFEHL